MNATGVAGLEWLYNLQRFGIKLGLRNIGELLARLGNPQHGLPCLHVAGTNGKGSVSLLLAEICRHAGYRVGLYTSPHLHCFTERIRVNGLSLPREQLPELIAEVQAAATGIPVTFFEATTALAFLAFRRAGVGMAVIETGMGGRLDATNVVEPLACFITPIGFDHQEQLGDRLAAIAAEKAGIIKRGVPVIAALQSAEAAAVLAEVAARQEAELWQAGRDFQWGGDHEAMWFRGAGLELTGLSCALLGAHQLGNFAQALAGAALLRRQGLPIAEAALFQAGADAHWPGRLEWFGSPPRVLLDGAHNQAGAASLAAYLREARLKPVRLVAGLSGRRRPEDVLAPLAAAVKAVYAPPVPGGAGVDPVAVTAWGQGCGLPARAFASPEEALTAALADRAADEAVVVAGSLYLVATMRGLLQDFPAGLAPFMASKALQSPLRR